MKTLPYLFALAVLLSHCAANPAPAQDTIAEQLRQIKANNESIAAKLKAKAEPKPATKADDAPTFPHYSAARTQAIREGKPLVVFVGPYVSARTIAGMIVCHKDSMSGDYPTACVVVCEPSGGELYWRETLRFTATDAEIREAVQPTADPFVQPSDKSIATSKAPVKATADDDIRGRGPWPKSLPFPDGLVRYRPAKMTQLVFNGTETQAVSRSGLEEKWNVPGGMAGVQGWKSDLYKFVPKRVETWKGDIPVWAGHYWRYVGSGQVVYKDGEPQKGMQTETSHQRSYPEGTIFADALSHDGKVFEIRYAEKHAGQWERYVAFRDVSARPAGYHRLSSRACVECHKEAGTGPYNGPFVPGGDTIISDPFSSLE